MTKKPFFTLFWMSSALLAASTDVSPLLLEGPRVEPVFEPIEYYTPKFEKTRYTNLLDKLPEKGEIPLDGTSLKREEVSRGDWSVTFHSKLLFEDTHLLSKKRHPFFSSKKFVPFQMQKSGYISLHPHLLFIDKRYSSSHFCKLDPFVVSQADIPIEKETVFIYENFSPLVEEELNDLFILESDYKSENHSLKKISLSLKHLEKKNSLIEESNTPCHAIIKGKILPLPLLPVHLAKETILPLGKEVCHPKGFVLEEELSQKHKQISFRIAKNFKVHFSLELNLKDLKDTPLPLLEEYYSYLDASVDSDEPLFIGDEGEYPYYAFIEQPQIAENSSTAIKHTNFFETEQENPPQEISTLEPIRENSLNASLIIEETEPKSIQNEDLEPVTTQLVSKISPINPPNLPVNPVDGICSTPHGIQGNNKASVESSLEDHPFSLLEIPHLLLYMIANNTASNENSFFPQTDKGETIFFFRYLEPSDKTLFRWTNFTYPFPLNPIFQPIHLFCEYVADLFHPFEEKLNRLFDYFATKYPLEKSQSFSLSTKSSPIDMHGLSNTLEKSRLFSTPLLSLPLPKVVRNFCHDFITQPLVVLPTIPELHDENVVSNEPLELADKLESNTPLISSKFVVFHHPLGLSTTDLNSAENKLLLPQKTTGLETKIASGIPFYKELPPQQSQQEIQTLYLPHKIDEEKNHLKVLYSSGVFLTHVNILHPGFIKISTQKEALLELFDAKTETLIADKDRLDLLPGQKFRTSISLEHKKMVSFEPVANDYVEKISIEKIEIAVLDSPQRKILKHFLQSEISLKEIPLTSKSLAMITGARMLNEQTRKFFASVDCFRNLPYLAEDVTEQFFTKATSAALSSKEGYGVEIELELSETARPSILDQEILFVLDGSKNTPVEHFAIYKQAILRSLKSLNTDTRFNILVVAKTVEKLFDSSVSASLDKQILAKRFLEKVESYQGSETGLLLKTCATLVPSEDDNTLTTVALMADSVKPQKQLVYLQETKKIVEKNQGNFQLLTFSLTSKDHQDLQFISMIGSGKNHIITSSTSFVRKFCSMIRKIKYPFLANLSITPLSEGVEILPHSQLIGPIFLNQPLKFYAVCEKNTPFFLLIQSMCDGKIVRILKEIKPISNESIRSKMKAEIQLKRAADAFRDYVKKENRANLEETNKRLELFDIQL